MVRKIVTILIMTVCFGICENVVARSYYDDQEKDNKLTAKEEKQRLATIKKELDAAKASIKSANEGAIAKSVTAINKLISADSVSMKDIRLHSMLFDLVSKQYALANEKLYLKQKIDTAVIYNLSRSMFETANVLDTVDATPDEKGKVSLKYRKSNATLLSNFVRNLYGGVVYFLNKERWNDAQQLASTYLSIPSWPLFSQTKLDVSQQRREHVAYMHLVACHMQKKYQDALQYDSLALCYSPRHETTMEVISQMQFALGNTAEYLKCLDEGYEKYPLNELFFTHLMDYYSGKADWQKVKEIADARLKADSGDNVAKLAKQTVLLNLHEYDDCIKLGKEILSEDDSIAECNLNTALAYWNQSLEIQKTVTNIKERTAKLNELYKGCKPYMEKYRSLRPDDKQQWKPILYTIYLNLNLGKEFAEIERM